LIKLNGVLDLNGTYSVEVQFVRHCAGEGVRVIVDLSKVSYMSSVGIPMLVNTAKSVVSRGGKIAFLRPQESVLKVLELVGVPIIVPVYSNLDSAIASMQ
jgi:anti-sigma B factor antagonist